MNLHEFDATDTALVMAEETIFAKKIARTAKKLKETCSDVGKP